MVYGGVLLAAPFALIGVVSATTTYQSPNYKITEIQLGTGSAQHTCSDGGQYCAKISIGDLVVGNSSSPNYTAQFGSNTTADPMLEVITTVGIQNLGTLGTGTTATATALVKVRNYLSGGYRMMIVGPAPTQGKHVLDTPHAPTGSAPGTEQFGINLVANSAPFVGLNPVQYPSGATSFGEPSINYGQTNNFMYVPGDVVAGSDQSSGQTQYTVSMIVNISDETPGGHYHGLLSAVVAPVF